MLRSQPLHGSISVPKAFMMLVLGAFGSELTTNTFLKAGRRQPGERNLRDGRQVASIHVQLDHLSRCGQNSHRFKTPHPTREDHDLGGLRNVSGPQGTEG